MKTSKLLITSLLAAATLSVPAFADDVSGDVAVSAGNSTAYVMTDDTTFTFTNNPTLTGSISGAYTLTTRGNAKLATGFGGTDDTRWTDGNLVVSAGTLQWGRGDDGAASQGDLKALGENITVSAGANLKLWLWTASQVNMSPTNKVAITSKIILNGTDSSTATLSTEDGSYYLSGGIQIGDGTNAGNGTFTAKWAKGHVIGSLSGAGTFTINEEAGTDKGTAVFSITGDGGFSGTVNFNYESGTNSAGAELHLLTENALKNATVNLTSSVAGKTATLSLDAGTVNIKGLTGTSAGSVVAATAGNTLAIATETGVTNTFSGTVGTSTSSVGLSVSGSGTQTLAGTNYLGDVSVTGGSLSLSGTSTVAGTTTVSGGTLDVSSGTHTFGNEFTLNGGKVVFGNVSLLGGTALLSASTITATSGTVEFSGIIKNGTYTIFTGTGSASLVESGISLTGTVNSGYTQTWTTNGYDITVTISDAARDLIWSGASGDWNTSAQNWTVSGETGTTFFNPYDSVTFNGDATVTVASGGVTAGAVNVTSGTLTLVSGGGKVTAVEGFAVDDGATLKLMSENQISGTLKVNSGGVFELNGHAKEIGSNGLSDVILNGGTLQNSLATTEIDDTGCNQQQLYKITLTANSSVVATQTFGLVSSGHGESTLNLGANTLTKSGAESFMLVNTTISGNGGVLDVTEGLIAGKSDRYLRLGEGVTLKTSGTGGATNIKIESMAANSKLILGGSTPSTVALNSFALGTGAVIDVSGANAVTGTLTSIGANAQLTFAGTGASAVTLNGAIGANAVVSVSGNSALTGTITSMAAGSSLTLNGTGAASSVTISTDKNAVVADSATINIANGSVTWIHTRGDLSNNRSSGASISIGADSSFTEKSGHKYHLTLSGTLSGAGTFTSLTPTNADQNDGWRIVKLSGSTAGFTGVWELETANGTEWASTDARAIWNGHNRHILGVLNSNDGIFGGVVKFTNNNADSAKVSSKLALLRDMTIGGLEGSLANTSVVGASEVGTGTSGNGPDKTTITTANRALTINVADGKSYDYAGKIDSTISLKKTGAGTQILSGDNSAYTGMVTLEAGTLGVGHANALGTSTVDVTGDAKLALGDRISITSLGITNSISIADSVKLTLGGGYAVALNGAITGRGTLRADMPWLTVALGGDNSGFSGAVEVVGTTVDAAHASALGTGILKISSADPLVGTERTSGTVQASAANVALHDVSIELVGADSAALRTSSSGSFRVAKGATLYLDIGLLTEETLTGEEVALTIAAKNAIDLFFADVQVGTYVDDAWQISSEWKYLADSWNVDAGTLKISAIPEPSMFGLLAGLGALALAGTRRRRRK